jgi:5-methylcytosine-specific restriction endonuclease McrA
MVKGHRQTSASKRKISASERREKGHKWKGGVATYRKIAFDDLHLEERCMKCGYIDDLIVHHQDRDRANNTRDNLRILCQKCHVRHHDAINYGIHPENIIR